MEETEAKRILQNYLSVSRETMERLSAFEALLKQENRRQNLVAPKSLDSIWSRHILDSAQLTRFAPTAHTWLDIGTGAGFPGLIVAILLEAKVTMIESRRLRADFLVEAAKVTGVSNTTEVVCSKIQQVEHKPFEVISARAVSSLADILLLAHPFSRLSTRWILPKGRSARSELEATLQTWQGTFHVEPSMTDPDAGIVVAEQVRAQSGTRRA